jgi:hypothetical protein
MAPKSTVTIESLGCSDGGKTGPTVAVSGRVTDGVAGAGILGEALFSISAGDVGDAAD